MKVILIGKGEGWDRAPKEGETWGVNDLCLRRPVKLIFQMHHNPDGEYDPIIAHANKFKIPIVMIEKHLNIPTSIAFPLEEIMKETRTDYFTSSMDYMVTYAMYKGAREIDMYGVHLARGTGYSYYLPSLSYWLGYAKGLGIKVNIRTRTTLVKAEKGRYGYEWDTRRRYGLDMAKR